MKNHILTKPVGRRAIRSAIAAVGIALALQTATLNAETPEEENSIGRRLEEIEKASTFIDLLKNWVLSVHHWPMN